jgi:hypothetical protein
LIKQLILANDKREERYLIGKNTKNERKKEEEKK